MQLKKHFLVSLLIISSANLFAAPAFTKYKTQNINGKNLEVSLAGNEYFTYFKTKDGVFLKLDKSDGKYHQIFFVNGDIKQSPTPYNPDIKTSMRLAPSSMKDITHLRKRPMLFKTGISWKHQP